MTDVIAEDGSKMETNLPADKVADLQAKPAPAAEPAKPAAQPASQTDDEPEPAKTEPEAPTGEPTVEPVKREKPKPIAKLLEERHTLREENAKLKADLEKAAQKPASVTPESIQAILDKHGVDDANKAFVNDLVAAIQAGINPQLPKEVQDLIATQKAAAEATAEEQAFKTDVSRLQRSLKDEQLTDPKVVEKLKALAYSDEKAPDGEEYYKKPLYELYMNFVKPEVEPGKPSAEPSRGGSKAGGKVLDFADIQADPAKLADFAKNATSEQFQKFHTWQLEHQKEPLVKPMF